MMICSIEDCNRPAAAKGWCSTHYQRQRRHGDMNTKYVESERAKKEKYGTDYHARIGASGGRNRTRGYLGKLKDEGRTDELKEIVQRGIEARKARTKEERSQASKKGWATRKQVQRRNGHNAYEYLRHRTRRVDK